MSAPMNDTLTHLAKENALLREQIKLFRREFHDPGMLRIETHGIRNGDHVICGSESFDRILGALIGPLEFVGEVLAGNNPLSPVSAAARILVAPYADGSRKYSDCNSRTVTLQCGPDDFFAMLPDDNLDCVIVNGIVYKASPVAHSTESTEGEALFSGADITMPLLREALRVSRKHVVLICEWADPSPGCTPETNGFIRQRGDCTTNWHRVDFAKHTIVLGRSVSKDGAEIFRRFGVIVDASSSARESISDFRLVVVSEPAADFEWNSNDIVVCDVEIVNQMAQFSSAYRSMTVVPLKLLRSAITMPQDILRSSILNFAVLEHYMRVLPTVVAQGTDAEFVVADLRAILADRAY